MSLDVAQTEKLNQLIVNMMRKSVLNFVVANLCGLLPLLWVAFGWMPDQVKVRMRGQEEAPGAIMANGVALAGEDYGTWQRGRIFRFYLRVGMEWKDLVFRFPGPSGTDAVECVELQKWKLLSLGKAGNGLVAHGDGKDEYVFANPRFDSVGVAEGKVSLALAAAEVLLVLLSLGSAKRCRGEDWKTLLLPALAMTLALTLLTQVILPLQSYWTNQSSYPFSFGELAEAVAWRFAWISVLGTLAVLLLARSFGRIVFSVVFAVTVCMYLEAAILSNGLARLNGDAFLLLDRTRALWDAAVWGAVFIIVLVAHHSLKNHYGRAFLWLMAVFVASLFETRHEKVADKSHLIVHDFMPIDAVVRNVTYSTNRNVLVFILDSLEREQAHAIMEDHDAGQNLRQQFRGFTEYTNNVGALPQTLTAVPNLLTGRYPDGTSRLADYFWSCYGSESVLRDYLAKGHDVFMTTLGLGCGYATRTNSPLARVDGKKTALDCPENGGDAWSIKNLARWRWMPFVAKASCSELTGRLHPSEELREWGVYPELARAAIDAASSGVFLWIHTEGVHVPIRWNRRGEMLPTETDSGQGCLEQGVFVMEKLGELMDAYRNAGIYDHSLILVLGDHGRHDEQQFLQDRKDGKLPASARPCLWIKPVDSTNAFRSSSLPTSHAKVAELLKCAAYGNVHDAEIESILQSGKRVYRRMALLGDGWTDWIVDEDGMFVMEEHGPTRASREDAQPLACGRRYSLFWTQIKNANIDVSFRNVGIDARPYLPLDTREASVEFRVPDPAKRYVLRLELYDNEGGGLRFRCDTPGAEWQEFPVRPHGEIIVHGVRADSSGMARVLFERTTGPDVDVAFTSLMLEKEKRSFFGRASK